MNHSEISISPFLDSEGRIVKLPAKQAVRTAVLFYLAEKFKRDRTYTEKEVNQICEEWHTFHDYFLVRRSLVDQKLLLRKRDGSCYWRGEVFRPAPVKEGGE